MLSKCATALLPANIFIHIFHFSLLSLAGTVSRCLFSSFFDRLIVSGPRGVLLPNRFLFPVVYPSSAVLDPPHLVATFFAAGAFLVVAKLFVA
jgi:hypothetical protein